VTVLVAAMPATSAYIKKFFFITIPSLLLLLLFLEFVVFRFILPASDWPGRTSIRTPDDVVRRIPGKGVYRRGFPTEIAAVYNNNLEGWNANREYVASKSNKKRIAVIGDSFVEAFHVDIDKAFAEVLQRDLIKHTGPNLEVYRFGVSGAPLSQYLQMLRYVNKTYQPEIVVVNIVENDFTTSILGFSNPDGDFLQFKRNDSSWQEIKPDPQNSGPTFIRTQLRHSALVRYLYLNLYLPERIPSLNSYFKRRDRDYQINIDVEKQLENLELLRSLCEHIFSQMKAALRPEAKLLLVMDANRGAIYKGADPKEQKWYQVTSMVRDAAGQQSIPFLDLTDAFTSDYKINKRVFEFKSDGHWNERAHLVVGETISKFIQDQKW
jgi:hypothetical protein